LAFHAYFYLTFLPLQKFYITLIVFIFMTKNFKTFLKYLLLPFAILYSGVTTLIHTLYDSRIFRPVKFDIPVISIGNLSTGGTGKTPHVEYLIELLQPYIDVATLSRGYGRKSTGFVAVEPQHTALEVGDEPLQYKRKYQDVFVTVCESREAGISKIMQFRPQTNTILLDDAFQHRKVIPNLSLLLTDYASLYTRDWHLPAGRLRERASGAKRADVIVVTKCPPEMSVTEKEALIKELQPTDNQHIFFSFYDYPRPPYYIFDSRQAVDLENNIDVLLVTGIARSSYLIDAIKPKVNSLQVMDFADHHFFKNAEVAEIKRIFDGINSTRKIILTTEKDAVRLQHHADYLFQEKMPIFALPAKVNFLFGEKEKFDAYIKDFLLDFRA
jgi:tetraacyldisaccharide 4'-kinase